MRVVQTAAVLAVCLIVGCGAANQDVRQPMAAREADREGDGIPDALDALDKDPAATSSKPRKARQSDAPEDPAAAAAADEEKQRIIYSARVTMAVFQVEQGLAAVESLARNMGGYLAQKHDREITIRVPRARFQPTLVAIDKVGDVTQPNRGQLSTPPASPRSSSSNPSMQRRRYRRPRVAPRGVRSGRPTRQHTAT
jgi:hypothetical protein